MEKEKQYNKFIRNPSNSNVLINVTLVVAFIILIISQVKLFEYMTQNRLRISNPTDNAQESTVDPSGSGLLLTASSDIQLTACADDDLANAIALVKPSIVNIDVVSSSIGGSSQRRGGPSLDFDVPSPQAVAEDDETLGSGIIVDKDGFILTAYHLIKDYPVVYVTVFSSERKMYKAELISFDANNDLALIKINADIPLPPARLGNSDLVKITDPVLTIGSPFGFEHTVTKGIVSDNARSLMIDGKIYTELLQIDAAINRGSAGGALINGEGDVIGINTAIVSAGDYFAGVGFAIKINKARPLLLNALWD